MKRSFFYLMFFIFCIPVFFVNTEAAVMEDYCQVPPYVIQNVPPNVMIILDNSGSMFNFAYFDGFKTQTLVDDNLCESSDSPCTGFADPGTYPDYKYYGYFDPDYWYKYGSNRFYPTAPKTGSGISGARDKNSDEWDGSFLNWMTMRRVDIMRKVLTGGKKTSGEGSGYERLIGENADCDGRGRFKSITNAENYAPISGSGQTRCFRVLTASTSSCNGSGSGTSQFGFSSGSSCSSFGSSYNVAVRVPSPVEGVLQSVVGTRARLGLSFYNVNSSTPQGGFVRVYISGGSLSSTVNEINLKRPNSNTPLAETLWTTAGYFAQQASISGGPGPRYNSGDFQINNNVDPMNYGTGGQPRYLSCARNFVLLVTDGEPCADGYLPGAGSIPSSIKNYAEGRSIYDCYDLSPGNPGRDGFCPSVGLFNESTLPSCYGGGQGGYVAGLEDVALWAHTTDLRSSTLGANEIRGTQNLTLYSVFAFGQGSTLLRYASINGGFEDSNGNNQPDLQTEWDQNGDGEPDTFYEATDGEELEKAIRNAFEAMLKRAASGTAASVLASGEGRGANLIQAVFYPRRVFGDDIIKWNGVAQNLWYYIDPLFINSSVREDTTHDWVFNLTNDYIATLYFDANAQRVKVDRCLDSEGDGDCDTTQPTIFLEDLTNLWEAGKSLWSRDISIDPRTIYTTINGSSFLSGNFTTGNASTLSNYLQAADINGNGSTTDEAEYIIRYIHGEGLTTVDLDGDGINDITGVDLDSDDIDDYRARYAKIIIDKKVWKLSDIINSTPRMSSQLKLNQYDTKYDDDTYEKFIQTSDYQNRGMVFAGGNDGMLHAFKLGRLELVEDGSTIKARLKNPDTGLPCSASDVEPCGYEKWAFIPKNALPYLKYIMDPDYCHLYTVDLPPYIFDASIGTIGCSEADYWNCEKSGETISVPSDRWRTIIIGGMRTGGACRGTTTSCTDVSGDGSKDCVNTPVDIGGESIGYSSYFALDITDQDNPQLLWEFAHPQLGFATTGPAVVRMNAPDDSGGLRKNGRWFVVFSSGPTGPIERTESQFLGRSDQNLRLFVLDLKTGSLLRTIDTGIQYAFAGSMFDSTNDSDLDYQDEAVYVGFTKRTGAGTVANPYRWTDGGVGRLVTKESIDPAQWVWRTLIDGIGTVTSSVGRLQNDKKGIMWLYFGTGRWYYVVDGVSDDPDSQRRLFGIKEPCFSSGVFDGNCTDTVSFGALTDVTDINNVPEETAANAAGFKGWYINLDASGDYTHDTVVEGFYAERNITDPVTTTTGLVFFSTYKPYSDECGLGGKTFIWATRYNTGGAGGGALKGKVIVQVSTGSIEQINLPGAFTDKGGRRTTAFEGVPPTAQGISILTAPPPVKRTIHIRER